ncbi:pyridoxal phosphate-dependent transferase [Piptocephalis cylindrospora]|uniref:sphinganine-1-phosphate aldolase n=1 Tax=Piptocephalis cylindrospora TaxID=1907219 RepID=A0A4P9Y774_9FUNG|nr:pyridoxal phosphate-dependent transferase [Piptocephalis cylindrospora]|eukprot:RKP14564.1 pyridoxal phosphate-dependent transferase [Piptocephalis cylindrospora]
MSYRLGTPSSIHDVLAQASALTDSCVRRFGPAAPGPLEWVKNAVFYYIVVRSFGALWTRVTCQGPTIYIRDLYRASVQYTLHLTKKIPMVRRKIQGELSKTLSAMEEDIAPVIPGLPPHHALPSQGRDTEDIRGELAKLQGLGDAHWKDGKVSGAIYHGGEELSKLTSEAYSLFSLSNPLHPDVFPGVRKMEAECVAMVLAMYNAPLDAGGCLTSGGTESIVMACKAYRDYAREHKGIRSPEMIIATSAHAAFDKACKYFGIRPVWIDVDPVTFALPVHRVKKAVNRNTILIVGSAPGFPHGIIDDIEGLSEIAHRKNVPLHVDACLGGFLIPFMKDAGYNVPLFDFRLPGVTSISCDTHKYGFAPKGSSIIMYRTRALRRYQYTVMSDWLGGVYASPGLAGSRPGALIAGCWSALMRIGHAGYVDSTRQIIGCAREIARIVQDTEGVEVLGEPNVSVVAFRATAPLSIYAIGDGMRHRGWNLNALQFPSSLHLACTTLTVGHEEDFARDLRESIAEARVLLEERGGKSGGDSGMAAIYGLAATLPDRSLIVDVAKGFIDALYKV